MAISVTFFSGGLGHMLACPADPWPVPPCGCCSGLSLASPLVGRPHGGGVFCCSLGCFRPSTGPGWGHSRLSSLVPRSLVRGLTSAGSLVSCFHDGLFICCSFGCFGPLAVLGWGHSRGVGDPLCIVFCLPWTLSRPQLGSLLLGSHFPCRPVYRFVKVA